MFWKYHLKHPREKCMIILVLKSAFFQKSDIIWSPGHYPYGYNYLISNKRDWNIIVSLNIFSQFHLKYYKMTGY